MTGSADVSSYATPSELAVDLGALGVMTVVAAMLIRTDRTISRREGAIALARYALFLATTIAGGIGVFPASRALGME